MKKVYIILLNYNGSADTVECLESILKLDYDNFQVLVVDNSETRKPLDDLLDWANGKQEAIPTQFEQLVYPLVNKPIDYKVVTEQEIKIAARSEKVVFIKADSNKGFASGNNIALNYVLNFGEEDAFAWVLNNDTVVEKNAVAAQVDYIQKSTQKIGILGTRLIYYHKPEAIQAVGGHFNKTFLISSHVGEGQPVATPKEDFGAIDYVIGAAMFVSKRFLADAGPMSEDYFLYYEELDWGYKAKEKGWTIDWCPASVVYHKEGASIGSSYESAKKTAFSENELFRSRKIFCKKFYGLSFRYYLSTLLLVLNRFRKGRFKIAAMVLKTSFSK